MDSLLWAALGLWVAVFCCRLLTESLRNFSRARLNAECRDRGLEGRFGEILARDDHAELAASIASKCLTVAAAVCTGFWLDRHAAGWGVLEAVLAGVAAVLLTAIGIVALPWAVSHVAGERIVIRSWPAVRAALVAATPLMRAADGLNTVVHRLAGRTDPDEAPDPGVFNEEIESVLDEGEREGTLQEDVSRMVQQIVELSRTDVRDVMTPRTDFNSVTAETPLPEARRLFLEFGHSRLPVVGDGPDDLRGVIYAKDLLQEIAGDDRPVGELGPLLREPLFVPETTKVDKLLEGMKAGRMHMAIILDEYGGVVGLVTLEDILEEIVGEIDDEYDPEEEDDRLVRLDERTIEVDARFKIDDLNRDFEYGLPEDDDFETIGGFVFGALDHVPEKGESVAFNNLQITVLEADRRRIMRVRVQRTDAAATA